MTPPVIRRAPSHPARRRSLPRLLLAIAVLAVTAAVGAGGLTVGAGALAKTPTPAAPRQLGTIMFSLWPNRARAQPLAGRTLVSTRRMYVFLRSRALITAVRYYLDDPQLAKAPWSVARAAPFNFNGTESNGSTGPFDLGSLADISHTITAAITLSNGTVQDVTATFRIRPAAHTHPFTRLVLDEEFLGTSLSPKIWQTYHGPGNGDIGLRSPSAVTLDGHGDLVITASMHNGEIVSGGIATLASYRYGQFQFRVKTDLDPQLNISGVVLIWPQSNHRTEGEDDFYETLAKRDPIWIFLHHLVANPKIQDYHEYWEPATSWHTVSVNWLPGSITVYYDGVRVYRDANPAALPKTPHQFHIQLDPSNHTPLIGPVRMYVSGVRIYQ